MKITFTCLLFILSMTSNLFAQSGSEVYLFDFMHSLDRFTIINPINISNNPGYDNQPSFSKDGSYLLFSSTRNGQTDIRKYELETGNYTWLTDTEGSEYSPTPMPDGKHVSAINLKPDGEQLLWKYSIDGSGSPQILVPELRIGYHAWYNQDTLISFVLGDSMNPASLQLNDLKNNNNEQLAINPGRSLHKIPESDTYPHHMSYVSKVVDSLWVITTLNMNTGKGTGIIATQTGSEDMAWTPDGIILHGSGSMLFYKKPGSEENWQLAADLNEFGLTGITRIAVSPKGDKLAVVVEN